MSVETENRVHAMALLSLSNPPAMGAQVGFVENTLTRVTTGVYRVQLVDALDNGDGVIVLTQQSGASFQLSGRIASYASEGPNNILLDAFDDAGDPADAGAIAIVIYRFPVR